MNKLQRSQKRIKLKGKVNYVIREQYLRDDVLCRSPLCKNCNENSETETCFLSKSYLYPEAKHYAIPCFDVMQKYLEIFQISDIKGVIILQSVAMKVMQSSGLGTYRKLLGFSRDYKRGCVIFLNEICESTTSERLSFKAESEWLAMCALKTAKFYCEHIENALPVLIISENSQLFENMDLGPNIKVLNVKSYLEEMWPNLKEAMDLYESISIADMTLVNSKDDSKGYDTYLPSDVLLSGIKTGRFIRGILRVNKHISSQEAYVTSSSLYQRDTGDILIFGMKNRNRAIHDDDVVVEILPKNEWKSRNSSLIHANDETKEHVGDSINCLPTGKVIGVLERRWRDYVVTMPEENEDNSKKSKSSNIERILVVPYDYRIPRIRIATKQADLLQNHRFIVRIDSWDKTSQYPNGHFVRVLGELGQIETDVQSLLIENRISATDFPLSLLPELPESSKDNPWKVDEIEVSKRRDLRTSHLIFSIDPKGCEDVDDALSVKELPDGNIELGVHIADVTYFVKQSSLTDMEARSRSTSVYLPDRRYDMLPQVLSADLCSLLGNVDRYAVSVIWVLDSKYDVLDVWYGRTVIRSAYQLCYEDAEAILNDSDLKEMKSRITELQNLNKKEMNRRFSLLKKAVLDFVNISRGLRAKRLSAGGLELNNINIKFEIDKTLPSLITQFHQVKELEVHRTVAECMIFANNWVAKQISSAFPQQSVLRRHPAPRENGLLELQSLAASKGFSINISSNKELANSLLEASDAYDPAVNQIFRILATRAMNEATYFCSGCVTVDEFSHYGLGISHYTHFTSPIRRYADVLVHRLLLASVGESSKDILVKVSELESLCNHMNENHRSAQEVEKAAQELFQACYFSEQANKSVNINLATGIIYSIRENGLLVLVPQYGIKGAVYLLNKDKKVSIVSDGVQWVDGSIILNESNLTVKSIDTCQKYSIFDKITVSINVQKPRAHQPKIYIDLVSNQVLVSEPSGAETEKHTCKSGIKISEDTNYDDPCESELPMDDVREGKSMYYLLHCLREMTLQSPQQMDI